MVVVYRIAHQVEHLVVLVEEVTQVIVVQLLLFLEPQIQEEVPVLLMQQQEMEDLVLLYSDTQHHIPYLTQVED